MVYAGDRRMEPSQEVMNHRMHLIQAMHWLIDNLVLDLLIENQI